MAIHLSHGARRVRGAQRGLQALNRQIAVLKSFLQLQVYHRRHSPSAAAAPQLSVAADASAPPRLTRVAATAVPVLPRRAPAVSAPSAASAAGVAHLDPPPLSGLGPDGPLRHSGPELPHGGTYGRKPTTRHLTVSNLAEALNQHIKNSTFTILYVLQHGEQLRRRQHSLSELVYHHLYTYGLVL